MKVDYDCTQESKLRLALAWLSWWLMLSFGGVAAFYSLVHLVLFGLGGVDLLKDVWSGNEPKNRDYLSIIILCGVVAVPTGAWSGVWMWAKLMRKARILRDERVRRMSRFR